MLCQTILSSLRLHDCRIASYLVLDTHKVSEGDIRTQHWASMLRDLFGLMEDPYELYRYAGTWAEAFTQMCESPTALEDFRFQFDGPDDYPLYSTLFNCPELLEVQLPHR